MGKIISFRASDEDLENLNKIRTIFSSPMVTPNDSEIIRNAILSLVNRETKHVENKRTEFEEIIDEVNREEEIKKLIKQGYNRLQAEQYLDGTLGYIDEA